MSLAQVTVIGAHLGRDAETRFTPTGKAVVNFNAATDRQFTGADGNQVKETTWMRCTIWPSSEAHLNYLGDVLKKGNTASFEGRLAINPETGGPRLFTRQDGSTGTSFEIVVDARTLVVGRNGLPQAPTQSQETEDLPF